MSALIKSACVILISRQGIKLLITYPIQYGAISKQKHTRDELN